MPLIPAKPPKVPVFEYHTPGLHSMFGVPAGAWMVGGDLSQLEARIVALLAGDEPMLACFRNGEDLHLLNALDLYEHTPESWAALPKETAKKLRDAAKIFLYGGLMYGGSPQTIWAQLLKLEPTITQGAVLAALKRWKAKHPAVFKWQRQQVQFAYDHGYVEVPEMGTRHHFWTRVQPTECLNFPIQGFGAHIMKSIVRRVAACIDWKISHIILQVHDALYLETSDFRYVWRMLRTEMCRPIKLGNQELPLEADIGVGTNWGNLVKISCEADLDKIQGPV